MATLSFNLVQVAELKRYSGSYATSIAPALSAAGLKDAAALGFDGDPITERLYATRIQSLEDADDRDVPTAKVHEGRRVYLPRDELQALDVDLDQINGGDVRLAVYAAEDGYLLFDTAPSIPVDDGELAAFDDV